MVSGKEAGEGYPKKKKERRKRRRRSGGGEGRPTQKEEEVEEEEKVKVNSPPPPLLSSATAGEILLLLHCSTQRKRKTCGLGRWEREIAVRPKDKGTSTHTKQGDKPTASTCSIYIAVSRQRYQGKENKCYPTNNNNLINFRLSSDAEIFVNNHRLSITNRCQNVQKCVRYVYTFRLSFHSAYHPWWLGGRWWGVEKCEVSTLVFWIFCEEKKIDGKT